MQFHTFISLLLRNYPSFDPIFAVKCLLKNGIGALGDDFGNAINMRVILGFCRRCQAYSAQQHNTNDSLTMIGKVHVAGGWLQERVAGQSPSSQQPDQGYQRFNPCSRFKTQPYTVRWTQTTESHLWMRNRMAAPHNWFPARTTLRGCCSPLRPAIQLE